MVSPLNLPAPAAVGDEWGNALNAGIQAVNADVEGLKGRTISTATGSGLLGGGSLAANRSLSVDFGTGAGKVVQGNDARLSDARTPLAHAHAQSEVTGLASALGALAPTSRLISAGSGLTGGGSLAADRTLAVDFAAATPQVDSVAGAVGTSAKAAREDHVHPLGATAVGIGAGAIVLGSNVAASAETVNAYRANGTVTTPFYVNTTAVVAADGILFTLPAGYRPPRIIRGGATNGAGAWVPIYIDTSGAVKVNLSQASGTLIYGHLTFVVTA